MLVKDSMLLSAKRRILPHPHHDKPDSPPPSPERSLWNNIISQSPSPRCLTHLLSWPPRIAPSGIWPSEVESPGYFGLVWSALIGISEVIWQLYLRVAHVSSAGCLCHRNRTARTSRTWKKKEKKVEKICRDLICFWHFFFPNCEEEPWPERLCVVTDEASWQKLPDPPHHHHVIEPNSFCSGTLCVQSN